MEDDSEAAASCSSSCKVVVPEEPEPEVVADIGTVGSVEPLVVVP